VDGADSTEVSDLNGFSDAEYRVYIRDRQINIHTSGMPGRGDYYVTTTDESLRRTQLVSRSVSQSESQLTRYAACSLSKYNLKSLWDPSCD
jgi:hypothetical protein